MKMAQGIERATAASVAENVTVSIMRTLSERLGPPAVEWVGEIQPVPLHRARVTFHGPKTRTYIEDVDREFREHLRELWMVDRLRPLKGDLAVVAMFAGKNRSARGGNLPQPDATNVLKALEDAGNPQDGWGGLWGDDKQITVDVASIVAWGRDVTPRIELRIWRLA